MNSVIKLLLRLGYKAIIAGLLTLLMFMLFIIGMLVLESNGIISGKQTDQIAFVAGIVWICLSVYTTKKIFNVPDDGPENTEDKK